MHRIRDALLLLLQGSYHDQVRKALAECRELQLELTGALEKLNAWAAKEYKRHRRALMSPLDEAGAPKLAPEHAPPPLTSMQKRGAIFRRAMAQTRTRPGTARQDQHEPDVEAREVSG